MCVEDKFSLIFPHVDGLQSRLSKNMLNDKFFRYTANLCLYVTVWGWLNIWNAQWGTSGSAINLHPLQERRWLVVLFSKCRFHNKLENCVCFYLKSMRQPPISMERNNGTPEEQ